MTRRRTSLLALPLALGLLAGGCDSAELESKIATLEAELVSTKKQLAESQAAVEAANKVDEGDPEEGEDIGAELEKAQAKIVKLQKQLKEAKLSKGELESELKRKEKALEAVKALQDSLAASLVTEIEAGDVSVKERDGYLVVSVSDKVLFDTGSAELSERGQKVIAKLADNLKALPEQPVFQVGGHTDNQKIKSEEVKAKFPTNWELSTARATNVVRYLEETSEIPGKRLVAAGFSQFRPVASNRKAKTRKRNRRIEIALLPPRD